MNNKISFAIVLAVLVLACSGMVSAYDIDIISFDATTVPPAVGVPGVFEVEYSNIGSNNFQVSSGYVLIDYDDGTSDVITMPPLTNFFPLDTAVNTMTHTYNTGGTYVVKATYIPSDGLDTSSANNEEQTIVIVDVPVWDFDMDDFDFTITQGYGETHAGQIENIGATSGMITIQVTDDLVGGSNILDANDISINIVGYSGTSFLINAGNTKYLDVTVDVDITQATGQYSGQIEIIEFGTSNVLGTADIDVLVLDNGGFTNYAPTITPISALTTTVGDEFIYNVVASDANGDPMYYSILSGPSGMSISNSGQINGWTPSTIGVESVTVEVTDLLNASTESFTVEAIMGSSQSSDIDISPGTINLGGSTQDRGVYVTEDIVVTNDGMDIITGISIELLNPTGSSSISSVYNADITSYATSLNPGASTTLSIEAYIPEDFDAGQRQIGTFRVLGTSFGSGAISNDADIDMEAKSYLEITDVEFEIDGDNIDSDEFLEGEDITVIVTIENTYGSSGSTIEDVYFTIEDNLWDVDENSDSIDLDDGDEEEFTATFSLDELMNDLTTTLTIRAYGDDEEENFEHYDEFTVDVEIEREDDDIRITLVEFDDDTVSTLILNVELEIEIQNFGNDDQDDVEIQVESLNTGISFSHTYDMGDLDSGDDDSETVVISLPSNLNPGQYQFRVTAGNDDTSDSETVTLTVASSTTVTSGSTGTTTGSGVTVTTPGTGTGTSAISNPVYGQSASGLQRFTDSEAYMSILLVAALLAVAALFFLIIASNAKSKRKKAARRRAARRGPQRQSIQIK